MIRLRPCTCKLLSRICEFKRELAFLSAGILLLLYLWPLHGHHQFTVEADTEILRLNTPANDGGRPLSQWPLPTFTLRTLKAGDGLPEETATQVEAATLLLAEKTEAIVKRNQHGPLVVELTNGNGVVGTLLFPEDENGKVPKPLDLQGPAAMILEGMAERSTQGEGLVLPIRGAVALGDDVAPGVRNVLLGGTVTILREAVIGEGRYVSDTSRLDRGDEVTLHLENTDTPAMVSGFVRVSAGKEGMEVLVLGAADYLRVDRLGSGGYEVRPLIWSHVLKDPWLSILTAVFALLLTVLNLVTALAGLFTPQSKQ